MNYDFKDFINKEIVKIDLIHDYLQIKFGNEHIINIYNNFTLKNESSLATLKDFKKINVLLHNVDINEGVIIFKFDEGLHIEVDISDEGYNSPEAINVFLPSNKIIVWN